VRELLDKKAQEILGRERLLISTLATDLATLDPDPQDLTLLEQAQRQLDELFLLVVVGEFNAGKSAFINALLGARVLPEGVTPTTTQIQVLKFGETQSQYWENDTLVHTYPAEWLRHINLVDTPGTNAVIQQHQQLTETFVPRSDLVLFVTSADRPFSESERVFVSHIKDWGKKVVVIVNKIDILDGPMEIEQVLSFVVQNAQTLLGRIPEVFTVSAKQTLQAKLAQSGTDSGSGLEQNQFEQVEHFISSTLDQRERIRLKLSSPLGVADRLVSEYLEIVRQQQSLLRDDVCTLETVGTQLGAFESDMRRDFKYHLSHVDNVLHEMLARGNEFFDETVRLRRVFDLFSTERVRGEFERDVVADTVNQIDQYVSELIDWMVEKDFQQWQAVMEFLNRRSAQHEGKVVGQVGGRFETSRRDLLASVGRAAQDVVHSYDKEKEARQLAESVQSAVAQAAIVQVGAIGLGAILLKVLATAVADVTGVLAAGAVAALGLYIIPAKRRRAKRDLQVKVDDLRDRLNGALSGQFDRELQGSLTRIRDAIAPYSRFVRAEKTQLKKLEDSLLEKQTAVRSLRSQIGSL